jgi:hypothetical protein
MRMSFRLDGRGPFNDRIRNFYLLNGARTGSRLGATSYKMDTGGNFLGVQRPVREVIHSIPRSTEVKNVENIHPLPHSYE